MFYSFKSLNRSQINISKNSSCYLNPVEIGTGEVSKEKFGVSEVSSAKVSIPNDGMAELSMAKVGIAKVGTYEISDYEKSADEVGTSEIGTVEVGTSEIGSTDGCLAEVRASETWTYLWMLLPSYIPVLDTPSEQFKLLLVGHNIPSHLLMMASTD
jgi:hypothetical protein